MTDTGATGSGAKAEATVLAGTGAPFRAWLLTFVEAHWTIVLLFALMMLLAGTHAFMIHYNRPPAVIQWCEGMITGTFTALIAKLKD